MSKLKIFTSVLLATFLLLAVFAEAGMIWSFADFLLTGRVPMLNFNLGFAGSLLMLCLIGSLIGRMFLDARTGLYESAIENHKVSSLGSQQFTETLDLIQTLEEPSPEEPSLAVDEDLGEAIA